MSELSKKLEAWRKYAERHSVSTRTLDRWVEDGILPEPDRIRGRKYLPSDTEPRRDTDAPEAA
jgi:predicted site-specific integrase-resolvase